MEQPDGKGNGISIGFEVCEPKSIVYADQWHSRVNTALYNPARPSIRNDFVKRWRQAVDCAAYLCKQTGIAPDHVLCHKEMNAIGKATNHADVAHWFDLFGQAYGMDAFRAAVQRVIRSGAGAAHVGKTMGNAVGRRAGNRKDVIC